MGLSFMRVMIGATDITTSVYSWSNEGLFG